MIRELTWRKRRPLAPFLSAVIPGLGQAVTGRPSPALFFFASAAIPFVFIRFLGVPRNFGHTIMFGFLVLFWLVNIYDAWRGSPPVTAPCIEACPAHLNIPWYIQLILEKRYEECHRFITRWIPLVGTIGHVCHHPCESKCTRFAFDEPVAICPLKGFVGNRVFSRGNLSPQPAPLTLKKPKRVAIIGSGPAGLTAGYFLARLGFTPVIHESLPVAGGMLAVGIPAYRLPRPVLSQEIAFIQAHGVEIKTGITIGAELSVDDLFKQGFDAVFAAPGTHRETRLRVPGEELAGVHPGVRFLRAANLGELDTLSGRVVVVGGGNVAMDAARSALRLGAEHVTVVYRRSRLEMPANSWEIKEAEEEGIEFLFLTNPVKVEGEGKVERVLCVEMQLAEPDASGRRKPIPVEGSDFHLPCDTLIPAIGLVADASCAESAGAKLSPQGLILLRRNMMTHRRNLFAGGDAVTGPASVIGASAQGREAALQIFLALGGKTRLSFAPVALGKAQSEFAARPRVPQISRAAAKRTGDFDLIHQMYRDEEAFSEGRRCLRCDLHM